MKSPLEICDVSCTRPHCPNYDFLYPITCLPQVSTAELVPGSSMLLALSLATHWLLALSFAFPSPLHKPSSPLLLQCSIATSLTGSSPSHPSRDQFPMNAWSISS